jgi:hypothetical protein
MGQWYNKYTNVFNPDEQESQEVKAGRCGLKVIVLKGKSKRNEGRAENKGPTY